MRRKAQSICGTFLDEVAVCPVFQLFIQLIATALTLGPAREDSVQEGGEGVIMGGPEIGIASIGAVAMLVGMYFVSRFANYTVAKFVGFLGAIFGGVVIGFIGTTIKATGAEAQDMWWYGPGLLAGFVLWMLAKAVGLPVRVVPPPVSGEQQ